MVRCVTMNDLEFQEVLETMQYELLRELADMPKKVIDPNLLESFEPVRLLASPGCCVPYRV
jgi:hypothetical protein